MDKSRKILLVEDNKQLNEINSRALIRAGYSVQVTCTLADARLLLQTESFDAIIMDVGLPDGSGFSLCREIRGETTAPILFLTAKTGYEDILEGLSAGGDDYLVKPYDLNILMAKIAAFFRRDEIARRVSRLSDRVTVEDLTLDLLSRRAFVKGRDIMLTPKEFHLLLLLAQNVGSVLTKEHLFSEVWQQPSNQDTRIIKNHISAIRKKLEGSGLEILSHRGNGYILEGNTFFGTED